MSKKGKVGSMPNAENYIRTKARQLPIKEVLINKDWKTNMATIVIAREHVNSNITAGFYLVDLNLMGVKDTYYIFNTVDFIYKEKIDSFLDKPQVKKIDYNLAHNIILEAVAFAEDCGFKPHRDYLKTTQYLLEEDDDAIELIDIECGHEGKPFYVQGPADDDIKAQRIIKQLHEQFGEGNYHYMLGEGFNDEDEYYEDEDQENEDDYDAQIEEFLDIFNNFDNLSEPEILRYYRLIDTIFNSYVNQTAIQEYQDQLLDEIPDDIRPDAMTKEFLGIDYPVENFSSKTHELIRKLAEGDLDIKKAKKIVGKLLKESVTVPFVQLCELQLNMEDVDEPYLKKLESYHKACPDYPLLHMAYLQTVAKMENKEGSKGQFNESTFSLTEYIQRPYLYHSELIRYLLLYLDLAILEKDLARIEALSRSHVILSQDIDGLEPVGVMIMHFKTMAVLGIAGALDNDEDV
jgi:hypothetical protein